MKKRLIQLPVYILFFAALFTGIIPLLYWVITGKDPADLLDKIENL